MRLLWEQLTQTKRINNPCFNIQGSGQEEMATDSTGSRLVFCQPWLLFFFLPDTLVCSISQRVLFRLFHLPRHDELLLSLPQPPQSGRQLVSTSASVRNKYPGSQALLVTTGTRKQSTISPAV